nr:hypothetical protein P5629_00130 [Bacillus subtilis]
MYSSENDYIILEDKTATGKKRVGKKKKNDKVYDKELENKYRKIGTL